MDQPGPATVRVGVVGAGRIARMFHLPILASSAGVELVAVADPDDQAIAHAGRISIEATPLRSLDELLERTAVDLVVLTTPSGAHAEQAVQVLERGLHVWVEKPLATTLADALSVQRAWRQAGTVGAVGFVFRSHPQVVQARAALRRGDIGRVVAASSTVSSTPRELPEWKRATESGGGALLDLASHHLDLIRFLFDTEISAVASSSRSLETEDDCISVLARTDSGVVATTTATARARQSDRIEIMGEEATLVIDRFGSDRLQIRPAGVTNDRNDRLRALPRIAGDALDSLRAQAAPRPEPSFHRALSAAIDAARGWGEPVATIADGVAIAAVTDAASSAAKTGRWVDVGQPAVADSPSS